MEALELIVECARNYNPYTRKVEKHGRVYADLSIKGIATTFSLPLGKKVASMDLKKLETKYESNKKATRKRMYQWREKNSP